MRQRPFSRALLAPLCTLWLLAGCLPESGPYFPRPPDGVAPTADSGGGGNADTGGAGDSGGGKADTGGGRADSGGGKADTAPPPPAHIAIEAETAQLGAPMVTQSNAMASGGSGIITPEGTGTNNDTSAGGTATFTFTVPQRDDGKTFHIWGRTISPDQTSDSFHARVDNGTYDIWDLGQRAALGWVKLNGRTAGSDLTPTLSAGQHTLTLRHREDGAFLDKIVVTADANYTPTGAGP